MPEIDPDTRAEIKRVEETLEKIRVNTSLPWWRSAFSGLISGAGAVVGSVLAIAILGWLLSLFGIIPGLGAIALKLQSIINSKF
jgi:hypothetical protein